MPTVTHPALVAGGGQGPLPQPQSLWKQLLTLPPGPSPYPPGLLHGPLIPCQSISRSRRPGAGSQGRLLAPHLPTPSLPPSLNEVPTLAQQRQRGLPCHHRQQP